MLLQTKEGRIALHVSAVSVMINLLLSCFKLFAGVAAHSGAMVSDAAHSASDVFSTLIVVIGVRMAAKECDKEHPYGHERMECVAAILLSGALFATGLGIGWASLRKIFSGAALPAPGKLALVAALISVLLKEAMYWYTRAAARRIGSGALMADAWHHRSDALSSVGSFAGILGARLGFPALDPIAGVVICILILKAALDIFRDAVGKMTDQACGDSVEADIRAVVCRQEGVLGIDQMKTRLFGNKIYVDLEIRADGEETLAQAHAAAQRAHDAVEAALPEVKHCMVHVNPAAIGENAEGNGERDPLPALSQGGALPDARASGESA